MPLLLFFYTAFERSLKNLDLEQKETVQKIIDALKAYYTYNCNLFEAQKIAPGFFYPDFALQNPPVGPTDPIPK